MSTKATNGENADALRNSRLLYWLQSLVCMNFRKQSRTVGRKKLENYSSSVCTVQGNAADVFADNLLNINKESRVKFQCFIISLEENNVVYGS